MDGDGSSHSSIFGNTLTNITQIINKILEVFRTSSLSSSIPVHTAALCSWLQSLVHAGSSHSTWSRSSFSQLWELLGLTPAAPSSTVPVLSGDATLLAGPNCITSMEVSFHFISGKLSRAQSPENCSRCPLHPSTTGDHFWTAIQAWDGIHRLIPETMSLPTCAAAKSAAAFPLEGEGEVVSAEMSMSRKHSSEAGLSYRVLLRETCSLLQGRSPLLSPEAWSHLRLYPRTLSSGGWPINQTDTCKCMQRQSKREVLKKHQVLSGWGVSSVPAVRQGLTHSGSAHIRVPVPRDEARLVASSCSHQPSSSLCWSVSHSDFVFQLSTMQFQTSPAISHWSLIHIAYPACRPHCPARQAPAEDPGASPCLGSSWSRILPRHLVAGPGNGASVTIFAVTSALHPHQLPDTGGRDTFLFTSGVMAEAHVILPGTRFSISSLNDAATNIYCHKRGYSNTSN